jgi:hypothetical protein
MGDWPIPQIARRIVADLASFANVQTPLSSLAFPVSPGEEWDIEACIACQMTGVGGVKFYFTFPAGCTGEMMLIGNIASVLTMQSLYSGALTVPATFFNTGAFVGNYRMRSHLVVGPTGGNIQFVGITAGATTTCVVKKGSLLRVVGITLPQP